MFWGSGSLNSQSQAGVCGAALAEDGLSLCPCPEPWFFPLLFGPQFSKGTVTDETRSFQSLHRACLAFHTSGWFTAGCQATPGLVMAGRRPSVALWASLCCGEEEGSDSLNFVP